MSRPNFADRDHHLQELEAFLRIPSVSGDPQHGADIRAAAAWVADQLTPFGGHVVETAGHPVVLGGWDGRPGAPTILVYGHYDVQPPGDERAWRSPPFHPTLRDGRLYARGATDDKGPMYVPLAVARAYLLQTGSLPLNVRFLFEGEEEVGSPSLPEAIRSHRDALAADIVISADGAMWRPGEPSLTVAAKGMVSLDIEVRGPTTDVHSGRNGGAIQNPLHALAELLTGLHDGDGRVTVAGFHDGILPLSGDERAALARVPFDDELYRSGVGVPELHGDPDHTTLERLWTRPTLEVNEIRGGGAFTVIPAVARAHLSARLVPGQEPEAVLEAIAAHLHRHAPPGVRVEVMPHRGQTPAYRIEPTHPGVLAAAAALRSVYPDQEPLTVRMGGSLPAAAMFEAELGLKTVFFSFSTSDEGLHAPDEFFRLQRLWDGLEAWAELWLLLAAASPAALREGTGGSGRR